MTTKTSSRSSDLIKIEIKMQQGLRAFFDKKEKKLLIVDNSSKDYKGEEYKNEDLLEINGNKYAIIQSFEKNELVYLNSFLTELL